MHTQIRNPRGLALNILELSTTFRPGGIQRHVLDLTEWLRGRGHSVWLGGTPGPWCGPEAEPQFLTLPLVDVSWEGGNILRRGWALARSVAVLRRFVRHNRIALVHSHESAPALVARLALAGLGVRQVVTYHGSAPDRVGQFVRTCGHADLMITPSHASAADLRTAGVADDRLKVIGLGLRPPPADDSAATRTLRESLLGDGTHLVVTIARITRQKGIEVLIDVVAALKKSHPHIRFALVGPGPDEAAMKAMAAEKGVAGHLTFVGRTERPHAYLRAADLFLLTSRWESLPFTIPEAFQVGTPVVATACSGVVELVDDSVGAVVPIGDVTAISGAVARICDDRGQRAAMAAAALERSGEDRFDPDHIHARIEAAYRRLISADRPAG